VEPREIDGPRFEVAVCKTTDTVMNHDVGKLRFRYRLLVLLLDATGRERPLDILTLGQFFVGGFSRNDPHIVRVLIIIAMITQRENVPFSDRVSTSIIRIDRVATPRSDLFLNPSTEFSIPDVIETNTPEVSNC